MRRSRTMTHNKPTLNPQVDPYEQTAAEEEAEFTRWERTRAIGG